MTFYYVWIKLKILPEITSFVIKNIRYWRNMFAYDHFFVKFMTPTILMKGKMRKREAIYIMLIEIFREDIHVYNASVERKYQSMTFVFKIYQRVVYFVFEWLLSKPRLSFLLARACPFIYVQFHLVFEPNSLSASRTPFRSSYIRSVW